MLLYKIKGINFNKKTFQVLTNLKENIQYQYKPHKFAKGFPNFLFLMFMFF